MKTKMFAALAVGFAVLGTAMFGQANVTAAKELEEVVVRIQEKLRAGEKSQTQLREELAALESLRNKYASTDPRAAARVAEREYSLYRDVLRDYRKTTELRELLKTKFRPHLESTRVLQELAMEEQAEKARAAQAELVGKPAPELNFVWSTQPDLKKLSDLKGKVVVLDFWATWCGPCIATFPQIRELVAHYNPADVIVVGVTSLQGYVSGLEPPRIDTKGDPAKEFALMPEFMKAKQMNWTVVFTDQRVFNPEYGVRGIPHMAIVAPDGTVRHNGLHPAMPHQVKVGMIDAILKEFGKQIPARSAGE